MHKLFLFLAFLHTVTAFSGSRLQSTRRNGNTASITVATPIRGSAWMRRQQHSVVAAAAVDESDRSFSSQQEYLEYVKKEAVLPKGFKCGATRFLFAPDELNAGSNEQKKELPMNVTLITLEEPSTSYATMFTSNRFCGGPILVGRDRYAAAASTDDAAVQPIQAVVVNNKVSNVCPGGGVGDMGRSDCESVCSAVADALGFGTDGAKAVFPSSTGVIGWKLPVAAIASNVGKAVAALQSESAYPAALGITTTDRYPKARTYQATDGSWRITGVAKGAGMIEPNLATMLAYLMTDLDVPRAVLQAMLQRCVAQSFNTVSVDGDQSTSDTVLLLSSQQQQLPVSDAQRSDVLKEFEAGLLHVCSDLSAALVRNGEGTQHVMRVTVRNAPDWRTGRGIGAAIVNSNLVKCAVAGNDPNVGRIVGAIGSFLGTLPAAEGARLSRGLQLRLGGRQIFADGAFELDGETERVLSDYMLAAQLFDENVPEKQRRYPPHSRYVDIEVQLAPDANADAEDALDVVVIGSDLTSDYVSINADYRS